MWRGNTAQGPERILQSLGQRDEAFAAEHDMSVFKAGKGQPEVIEPVVQWLTGDGDAEIAHVGEVGLSHPARRMLLTEDPLPVRAIYRAPGPNAPLQRPPHSSAEFRVSA